MKKLSVRGTLLLEVILLLAAFCIILALQGGLYTYVYFIDIPSLCLILAIVIIGMFILGCRKDFHRAFSIGQKPYTLLELKNIKLAVSVCQRLVICAGIVAVVIGVILYLQELSDPATVGPNLAVIFLSAFYAAVLEYLLLPLSIAVERAINAAMDLGELDEEDK